MLSLEIEEDRSYYDRNNGYLCCRNSLKCLELSNSGDALKLPVPNDNRKIIRRWSNHSCMVTNQKMIEKEIGNRGSNSVILKHTTVKEQRVNGSWNRVYTTRLRCTLMGRVSGYLIKIPSNQINKFRNFCTTVVQQSENKIFKLHPRWITGFVDAEGCFSINVYNDSKYKMEWRVQLSFQIELYEKDLLLLEEIHKLLKIGKIYQGRSRSFLLKVSSMEEIKKIIEHFDKK